MRPRTRATIAFACFATATGVSIFIGNLWQAFPDGMPAAEAIHSSARILYMIAGAAIVELLATFPRQASRRAHLALWGSTLAILMISLVARNAVSHKGLWVLLGSSPIAIQTPLAVGAVYLAWRFGVEDDARVRSQIALMSAGTVPYVAMSTGDALARYDGAWAPQAHTVFLALATLIWLRNSVGASGSTRVARNVALLIPALVLTGMLARAWIGQGNIDDTGVYGIARALSFAILSYAIVRYRLLGIDVKLRFAISKSTLAAAFIAVFFIASETAQQFFGETLGSTYVGIGAAGMLVFAMAPLQRVAERLAERAVPVTPAARAGVSPQEAAFRESVLLARRGGITAREEIALARIADAHGLTVLQTAQIRADVEREASEDAT